MIFYQYKFHQYQLWNTEGELLINIGEMHIGKQDKRHSDRKNSYLIENPSRFKYHKIDNALRGDSGYFTFFEITQFIVIQMN